MTLKEAVLKSLEDLNEIANHLKVLNHINTNHPTLVQVYKIFVSASLVAWHCE